MLRVVCRAICFSLAISLAGLPSHADVVTPNRNILPPSYAVSVFKDVCLSRLLNVDATLQRAASDPRLVRQGKPTTYQGKSSHRFFGREGDLSVDVSNLFGNPGCAVFFRPNGRSVAGASAAVSELQRQRLVGNPKHPPNTNVLFQYRECVIVAIGAMIGRATISVFPQQIG